MEQVKTEERRWCVYMHTNKINNKVYVGITNQKPEVRWRNGKGYQKDQSVFYRAIKKYRWDGFEHIIFAENLTESEANQMEMRLIALYKTNCCRYKNPEYGYNMTDGGDGHKGWIPTEENRINMSNAQKGKKLSEEHKRKISQSEKGKKISKEHKEKISQALKGRVFSEETRKKISESKKGKPGNNKGKKMPREVVERLREMRKRENLSEETLRKMSESAKNKSAETRKKISDAAKERYKNPLNVPFYGKHHTEESKEKLRKAHNIPIVQLTRDGLYIMCFNSGKEASKQTNVQANSISKCCRGGVKSAGGYRWKYLYDQTQKDGSIIHGAITLGLITEEEALAQLTQQND